MLLSYGCRQTPPANGLAQSRQRLASPSLIDMCCKNKQQSRTARLERTDPRLRHLQTESEHRDPASDAPAAPTGPGAFGVTRAALRPIVEGPPPAYASIEGSSGPYDAVTIKHTASRSLHNAAEAIEGGGRITRTMDSDVCSRLGHKACLSHEISPAAHKQAKRRYGKAGVIGGIVFFPWGLFW